MGRRWLAASVVSRLLGYLIRISVAVLVGVVLASFFCVMNRVHLMTVGHVGVVSGLFVIAGLVVVGSRAMMLRSVIMMLGGFAVMIRNLF